MRKQENLQLHLNSDQNKISYMNYQCLCTHLGLTHCEIITLYIK